MLVEDLERENPEPVVLEQGVMGVRLVTGAWVGGVRFDDRRAELVHERGEIIRGDEILIAFLSAMDLRGDFPLQRAAEGAVKAKDGFREISRVK